MFSPLYKDDFSFPTEEVLEKIDSDTKLIIFSNPNNPLGTLVSRKDIVKILKKANNSIVVIDEVYEEFTKVSCIDLIKDYDNLFIIKSFSKAFGLASLRVGYILSNSKNIKELTKVGSPYNVNQLGIIAATAVLDDIKYMKNYAREVLEVYKPMLEEYFNEKNMKYFSGTANFILLYFENPKKIYNKLKEHCVLIRMKEGLENYVRISIGTVNNTKELISVFNKILNKI